MFVELKLVLCWLEGGYYVGVMSEVGCLGIVDLGSIVVVMVYENGICVFLFVGLSSILFILIGFGFNG